MIKAVLFDYGGVLSESGKVGGIPEVLGKLYGVDPQQIRIADLHEKLLLGEIAVDDFFAELNRRYGQSRELDAATFTANNQAFAVRCQQVYDMVAKLRAAGIKTGILSNVYQISGDQLRAAGCYNGFDPVLLSCEVHLAKPDPAVYRLALERLGLSANEVLFIDDQQRLMPPESLGIHTILAVSPQQIEDDIRAIIQKENNLTLE